MERRMVECEDGRTRQARVYGIPREEENFKVLQAGVRIKGRHVTGEVWQNVQTGMCYFLAGPEGKNMHLLPRYRERPDDPARPVLRSPTVRTA